MQPSRRVAALASLAVLTLTLSGCVRMGVEMELKPDDTVASSIVLAVEDKYLDQTGQSPDSVIDTLTKDQDDPAQEAERTEDFEQDGYTGTRYVYPSTGLDGAGAQVGWPIEIVRKGGEYLVAGTLDLTEEGLGGRAGASVDNLSVTVDITFPGKVKDANGTIDGRTVRWEPTVGESVEIHARGVAVGPSENRPSDAATTEVVTLPVVPEWMVLVLGLSGLVILLLIGVIVWQVMMRVRDQQRPAAAAPAPQQRTPLPPSIPPGS